MQGFHGAAVTLVLMTYFQSGLNHVYFDVDLDTCVVLCCVVLCCVCNGCVYGGP